MISELLISGWETLLEYLSAHVLLCLVPAFFLSGAFNALIPDKSIFKFMGGKSIKGKALAYFFAATSGLLLEVCSCTILPLFAGIWEKGAGFGPAITFLFAGPGITLLSTPLTAAVIGSEFAVIKLVLSIIVAITIGLVMELLFKNNHDGVDERLFKDGSISGRQKPYQSILFFGSLLMVMVFGTMAIELGLKLVLVGMTTLLTIIFSIKYYSKSERKAWLKESWGFVKLIFPILLIGVFASGVIKPLIKPEWIAGLAGSNTLLANFLAVLFGTIAYFPTLVEVPIAKMFMDLGMHAGPLMSYLIADPAVSIQTLLVVNKIIKPKRTIAYAMLILLFSMIAGFAYGALVDSGVIYEIN